MTVKSMCRVTSPTAHLWLAGSPPIPRDPLIHICTVPFQLLHLLSEILYGAQVEHCNIHVNSHLRG